MHILMLSLTVVFVVCVLLLVAAALFAMTPLARNIEEGEQSHRPRFD